MSATSSKGSDKNRKVLDGAYKLAANQKTNPLTNMPSPHPLSIPGAKSDTKMHFTAVHFKAQSGGLRKVGIVKLNKSCIHIFSEVYFGLADTSK